MFGAVGFVLADLIDIYGTSKAGAKWPRYPRPADVIRAQMTREAQFRALEEQSERNRLREADA